MGVTFEHPGYLWLMLLALPMAWAGLRWFAAMSRARRWSAVLLRVALVALITGMLAGAAAVRRTDALAVIAVIDVSGSVRLFGDVGVGEDGRRLDPLEAARAYFREATGGSGGAGRGRRGADDLVGVVVFDGRALAVATPTRGDPLDRELDVRMSEGTNIGEALRYAAALIPPDAAGRIVLFSDGDETAGDAVAAASELAARPGDRGRVPVDVVPVRLNVSSEVMVEGVDAPPRAPGESTVTVRVSLRATGPARGTLTLLRDGEPVDISDGPGMGRALELAAGPRVELISVPLPVGKIHRFEAVFEPEMGPAEGDGSPRAAGDTRLENNRGSAFTLTPGRGSVLLVDGAGGGAGEGSALARALRASGIDVEIIAPEGLPSDLLSLQQHDLVVLDNVPVEAVAEPAQRALSAHVRDLGAGLVMVGGPDSFGAGGWKGSHIEPLLPVRLDLPEQLVQPDAAVVLVMDNSGSMSRRVFASAQSQQEIANEAAAMAVRTLDRKDLVGIIVFNSETSIVVPLGPNANPARTADRIMSISSGGGTVLGPALEAARQQLRSAEASVKHVIVLSDGASTGREVLPQMAAKMREEGINVSAIGIGDEMDEQTMAAIAGRGGGRFYAVNNPNLLPRFFLQAVRVVRQPLVREGEFAPVILPSPSPLTAGLSAALPLYGLVLTQARPEPTITYAMSAPGGEPLLAHWPVGLGQVAAWTSDAGPWARAWMGTPEFTRLWTQIARTIARPAASGNSELTTEVVGEELRIRLDALDDAGRPRDLLSVPVNVYPPGGGEPVRITLSQTGPGLYEGRVPARQGGTYVVTAQPRQGNQALPPVFGGASLASGVEFRRLEGDPGLLRRIAEITGGRVLPWMQPEDAALFDRRGLPPSTARTPLWRPLLLWTLIVLLLDIATRRVAWDRFVSREFGVELTRSAAEAIRDRGEQATRTITGLRSGARKVEAASAALSEEDAARLVEEGAQRRREARLAAMAAKRTQLREEAQAAAAEPVEAPVVRPRRAPEAKPAAQPGESGTEGLLAAKRRARERLEGEEGGG